VSPFDFGWGLTPPVDGSTAVLNGARTARASFVPDMSGAYTYTVGVTDALGYSSTKTGTVGVADCTPTPPSPRGGGYITFTRSSSPAPSPSPGRLHARLARTPAAPAHQPLPLAYFWTFDSVPRGSTPTSTTPASPTRPSCSIAERDLEGAAQRWSTSSPDDYVAGRSRTPRRLREPRDHGEGLPHRPEPAASWRSDPKAPTSLANTIARAPACSSTDRSPPI